MNSRCQRTHESRIAVAAHVFIWKTISLQRTYLAGSGKPSVQRVASERIGNGESVDEKTLIAILDRYRQYEKYLKYPGEWGERTFRAWLVFEIFHESLKWPISNIVFDLFE